MEAIMFLKFVLALFLSFSSVSFFEPQQNVRIKKSISTTSLFLDNFATYYYSHLSNNRSYNLHGSCGYVAISLFLSYYDTFWNDCFIPEQYEAISHDLNISPGVKSEEFFVGQSESQISSFIRNNTYSNSYFQFLLFKIGYDGGYISCTDTSLSVGVSNSIMDYVLNTYLYDSNYLGLYRYSYMLDDIDSNDTEHTSLDVKNFAINYVKKGFPVIIGIPGHVTVAYDYDEVNDNLYGHWGWGDSDSHRLYTSFSDSWALVLDADHVHTANYIIDEESICPCDLACHIHDYSYRTSSYDSFYHKNMCYCDDYELDMHILRTKTINGKQYKYCTECDYLARQDGIIPLPI